jgi:hypothetical protein
MWSNMAPQRTAILWATVALWAGCSTAASQSIHAPTTRVRSAVVVGKPAGADSHHRKPGRNAAGPVEESLHSRGVRFGTDGSAPALFAFVRERFAEIPAASASTGDVLFFDLGAGCGGHAGLVETSEPSGRIGFREWRDGNSRHSYVTPREPVLRRDGQGRIMNTFLRPKRMDDSPETCYFAGEMLCAVFHVPSS